MADLVIQPPTAASTVDVGVLDLVLRDRRSPNTARAYAADLKAFFNSRGEPVSEDSVRSLCTVRTGELAIILNTYLASMRAQGLKPSTINRRLSAVRSLLRMARRMGKTEVDPAGLVDNEKTSRRSSRTGPTVDEVNAILARPDRATVAGKRDLAVLTLMWENALRRAEVSALDIEHFDPVRCRLFVTRKGHSGEPEWVEISARCAQTLTAYVDARSTGGRLNNGEPLFCNFSRAHGGRLMPGGVYDLMERYGAAVLERPLSPHQMRHAACTHVIDVTGDLRAAQELMGHADPATTALYDDRSRDRQRKATQVLSESAHA